MAIALLWLTAAVGGICEWYNHRRFAAFCMFVTLVGFTLQVHRPAVPHLEKAAEAKEHVGLSVGGLYHVSRTPGCHLLHFKSAEAAELAGWEPCPECVLAEDAGSSKAADEASGERDDGKQPVSITHHAAPR